MSTTVTPPESKTEAVGAQFPFDGITEPGAYVSNWSGHLMRIPEEALRLGHSPVVEIRGKEPLICTKVHNDPYVSLNKVRMLAADLDLAVNF